MKEWLAVTLHIPRDAEEAVANFLVERGAAGIEELEEDLKWKRVKTYLPKDGREKKVLRGLGRYLKSLRAIYPEISNFQIETAHLQEEDWSVHWKKFFRPVQVSSTFVVKPPWSAVRLKRGQVSIEINPGMAFGTGTHATTQLSIQALEKNMRGKKPSVLDMGTGSGILAIAAAKLGASEVYAVDIDGAALENARENIVRNDVSDLIHVRQGSVGSLRKRFDIIVANIDVRNLRRMKNSLIHHLNDRGLLILSGILDKEKTGLQERFLETGAFGSAKATRQEEWACLTLKKK
jgi:ribosomal protein L11 methyltransferase